MRLILSVQLMFVALVANAAIATDRQAARDEISRIADDKAVTDKWVQTETIVRMGQSPSSSLTYVAMNLANAKDQRSLDRIFNTAANDRVDPLFSRSATIAAIKAGSSYFTRGRADGAIAFADKVTRDLENNIQTPGAKPPFSLETQAAALIGAVNNMPANLRESAMRKLAQQQGLNYDDMQARVRGNRLLQGIPSKDHSERSSTDKALDQSIFDTGLDGLRDSLVGQQLATEAIRDNLSRSEQLQKQLDLINSRTEHFKASMYLAGVVLTPVLGEKASQITQVGDGLIRMQEAVNKFGPGGLTPDKLLMCSNFVSAGMMVAQVFMKQPDPTMTALTQIMSQLQDIKRQLDIIDRKIDHLTDAVMKGFSDVLHNQGRIVHDIQQLKDLVETYVNEEKELDAVNSYLSFLQNQQSVFVLANRCASQATLPVVSTNECLAKFADELSTRPLAQLNLTIGQPHIFDPAWTNLALSVAPNYDRNGGALPRFYFSLPRFFANAPSAFAQVTARNQEAVAAASQVLMQSLHPVILANPQVLDSELSVLVEAARLRGDMVKLPGADLVFSEADQRIKDIETFVTHTLQNPQYVKGLWAVLQSSLKVYEDHVETVISDAMSRSKDSLKRNFLGSGIHYCDPNMPHVLHLPANGPGGNIETLVPDIYWSAADIGLGQIGKCFEWSAIDTKVNGRNAFHNVRFRILIFWNPAHRQADGSYTLGELKSGRVAMSANSQVIQARYIDSERHFSTFWDDTTRVFQWAWDGWAANANDNSPSPDKVYECAVLKQGGDCLGPHRFIPANVFMVQGKNEIPDVTVDGAAAGLKESVYDLLAPVIRSQSRIWVPDQLAPEKVSADKILFDRPAMTSGILADRMSNYSSRYMFVEQLLLLSSYHDNAVGKCLLALDDYSPESVGKNLRKAFRETPWRLSDTIVPSMENIGNDCVGKNINSDLKSRQIEVQRLLKASLRNAAN